MQFHAVILTQLITAYASRTTVWVIVYSSFPQFFVFRPHRPHTVHRCEAVVSWHHSVARLCLHCCKIDQPILWYDIFHTQHLLYTTPYYKATLESDPGTPCTKDSTSLGACRRLGQDETNTTQQGC